MLSRLFRRKPRLTDADPARRREAVLALDAADEATFRRVATEDANPSVRIAALARIASPDALGALLEDARQGDRPELATAAADRLVDLGDDHAFASDADVVIARFLRAPTADRLDAIGDPRQAARAVVRVPDVDTRTALADTVQDEQRLIALEHLARTRDKAVHRIARDRLGLLKGLRQDRDDLVRRAESIIASAERVRSDDAQLAAKCDVLRREWATTLASLEENATALEAFRHAAADVDALRTRFRLPEPPVIEPVATSDDGPPLPSFESLLSAVAAVASSVTADPGSFETTTELSARLHELQSHWSRHADREPPDEAQAAAFRDRCQRVHALIEALDRARDARSAGAAILATEATFTTPETDEDYAEIWRLQSDARRHAAEAADVLRRIDWPADCARPPWMDEVAARETEMRALDERCHETFSAVQTEISSAIEAMEQAVEAGEVNEASRLRTQANRWVHRLPRSAQDGPGTKLSSRSARLRELADWQSFAERGKREVLCDEIEAIADNPLPPDAQMARIKELRGRVRALGRLRSAADRALMDRFNAGAERAFEPCRQHFAALAEERRFNLEQREAICAQLESFVAANDWQHADYRGVEQILRQARAEWRAYHPVDRSPGKKLDTRFKAVTDDLYGHLKVEWDRNVAAKQAIVDEAREATQSDVPLGDQINTMKRLQANWKHVGTTPRRVDQQLWKEFRGICDRVFENRDVQRDERRTQTTAAVSEANTLIDALRSEVADETDEVIDPRRAADYRHRVEALERLPAEVERRLRRAWSDFEREVRLRRNRQPILEKLTHIDAVDTLDADLASLERAGGSTEAWLARAADLGKLFAGRTGEPAATADEDALRRLTVEAEIAAGVDSPQDEQALRLQVQMGRLQAGIGVRDRTPVDVDVLLQRWCENAAGIEPAATLRTRFFTALRQVVDQSAE